VAAASCSRPLATITYHCEGGDSIVAGFGPRFAELHLPPDRVLRLQPEQAASGARYSDGRYAVHTKGDEALLERNGKVVLSGCRPAGADLVELPDTVVTPERAKSVADSIDQVVAAVQPTVKTLPPEQRGWKPRVVSLWTMGGLPARLTVTEPADSGRASGLNSYYFREGRVEVVRGPQTQYVFRDTTLIFWTTDSLRPIPDLPLRDMVARQNFVLGEVRQYLAMFGIE
jgi:membrane-bound inhibitor of C-type lysozyme